jgi:hypothetical protein
MKLECRGDKGRTGQSEPAGLPVSPTGETMPQSELELLRGTLICYTSFQWFTGLHPSPVIWTAPILGWRVIPSADAKHRAFLAGFHYRPLLCGASRRERPSCVWFPCGNRPRQGGPSPCATWALLVDHQIAVFSVPAPPVLFVADVIRDFVEGIPRDCNGG